MTPERKGGSAPAVEITTQDIAEFTGINPALRAWFGDHNPQTINAMLSTIVGRGLAVDAAGALEFLNDTVGGLSSSGIPLAKSDFTGKGRRVLEQLLSQAEPNPLEYVHWQFGRIGHQLVGDLLAGKIPAPNEPSAKQGVLEGLEISNNSSPDPRPIKLDNAYLRRIRNTLDTLSTALAQGSLPQEHEEIKRLRGLIHPIFTKYLSDLEEASTLLSGNEYTITLMSWAQILLYAQARETNALFREVSILGHYSGLRSSQEISVGQVDAIEPVALNYIELTHEQKQKLSSLAKNGPYRSVIDLIKGLNLLLGGVPEFRLKEWKFSVGDSGSSRKTIQPEDIEEKPMPAHERQVREYLTFCTLAYTLAMGNKFWPRRSPFQEAELVYFLPNREPVTHAISMSSRDQEEFLRTKLVPVLSRGRRRALRRAADNLLVRALKDDGRRRRKNNGDGNIPQLLTADLSTTPGEILERYRSFLDPGQIVEIAGEARTGEPIFLAHLDRLLHAIGEGGIKTSGVNLKDPKRGGFITCLSPAHEDPGPSMHLYLKEGHAHCFGCGLHIFFAAESIPANLGIKIPDWKEARRSSKNFAEIEIPWEHHNLLLSAGELFHEAFWESPAVAYLEKVRRIDPHLAFSLGVGFATNGAVGELLASGHNFEELIKSGLIKFSKSISRKRSLLPTFEQFGIRGAPLDEGLPYCPLSGRLVFPLEFESRNTNIYGRALDPCPDHLKHRKLTTKFTGIPQGGFNMGVLQLNPAEVIITEGVMDTLWLIQEGYENTFSIIGTHNTQVLELAGLKAARLAIALDNDKGGKEATGNLINSLGKAGVKTRNFTADFLLQNPELAGYGDFGEMPHGLVRMG